MLTNRAIWVIERNFGRVLTLGELAVACKVSPFHLAHAFGEATGQSVMQYVRGRRLTAAALALAGGATDILELAIQSGYGSHEAFSRAFRAQFGTTPQAVRKAGSAAGLALVTALDMLEEGRADVASARLERAGPMSFVGLWGHYAFSAIRDIPEQWARFMRAYQHIPHKADCAPVGISIGFDGDGEFDYLCAVQVVDGGWAPPELARLDVAAQSYAVFQHRGHVATIRSTYTAIWNHWLPESGRTARDAPIIERHNPAFDPGTGLGGLEIWIPVADRRSILRNR